jgi:hypothetical protein
MRLRSSVISGIIVPTLLGYVSLPFPWINGALMVVLAIPVFVHHCQMFQLLVF